MPSFRSDCVVGISAFFHDSAAAVVDAQGIVAAAQEERFSRCKHDVRFPRAALAYVLEAAGADLEDVEAVAFYEKPLLKFGRIMEMHRRAAPRGWAAFTAALPGWARHKLLIRRTLQRELQRFVTRRGPLPRLYFPAHHVAHAASAFYPSPFEEAAIVTIDGVGEWATATIAHGCGRDLTMLRELRFPDSAGLLYTTVTTLCGFAAHDGEYKLMGLAPFGGVGAAVLEARLRERVVHVYDDGSLQLNPAYFDYAAGLRMARAEAWQALLGFAPCAPGAEPSQAHADLALAVQRIIEDVVMRMVQTAVDLTGCRDVVLAGGVALNGVANGKLLRSGVVRRLWIQPAAGDAGGALGAAYAVRHIALGLDREATPAGGDAMQAARLGPDFSRGQCLAALRRHGIHRWTLYSREELLATVARRLQEGAVVGWFQGRMEWGPRALGGRSILADPRDHSMRHKLNARIKGRESFRPFAPVVRVETAAAQFELEQPSPYMLLVVPVRNVQTAATAGDSAIDTAVHSPAMAPLNAIARLDAVHSPLAAVTHVDGSARVQTLARNEDPLLWDLLAAFEACTGCPALLNTSFNRAGEPIVCTPDDAVRCYVEAGLDLLVLGDVVVDSCSSSA